MIRRWIAAWPGGALVGVVNGVVRDAIYANCIREQTASSGLSRKRTRLVVSGYALERLHQLVAFGSFVFWEPAHVIMQTRQFANLKCGAERSSSSEARFPATA